MTARCGIIPIFIPHLGCEHECVFCNQKRISGRLRPAAAQDVAREIEAGLGRCRRPAQCAFYGGSFTAIPAPQQLELLGAAQKYLRSGELSGIRLSTRPDAIDETVLERLHLHGVSVIELGAQSMDNVVLRKSGRGHSAEDTVRAAGMVKRAGFSLVLQMMTGLPGSDEASDVESARKIISLAPDAVRIYPTVIIKDTPLYKLWRAGKYAEHTVEDAVRVCAVLLPMFERAGIPVIRLGLNPTEELSGGAAAGGAYHPALGELVKSRVMLNRVRRILTDTERGREILSSVPCELRLHTSPSSVSQLVGQRRCNADALCTEFGFSGVKVIPLLRLPKGEIELG